MDSTLTGTNPGWVCPASHPPPPLAKSTPYYHIGRSHMAVVAKALQWAFPWQRFGAYTHSKQMEETEIRSLLGLRNCEIEFYRSYAEYPAMRKKGRMNAIGVVLPRRTTTFTARHSFVQRERPWRVFVSQITKGSRFLLILIPAQENEPVILDGSADAIQQKLFFTKNRQFKLFKLFGIS